MHVPTLKKKKRHLACSEWNIEAVETQEELGCCWMSNNQLKCSWHWVVSLAVLQLGQTSSFPALRFLRFLGWSGSFDVGWFSLSAGGVVGRCPSAVLPCAQAQLDRAPLSSSSPAFLLKAFPAVSWCAKQLKLAPDCSVSCVPEKWRRHLEQSHCTPPRNRGYRILG